MVRSSMRVTHIIPSGSNRHSRFHRESVCHSFWKSNHGRHVDFGFARNAGSDSDPFRVIILGFGGLVLAVHVLEVVYLLAKFKSRVRSSLDIVSVLVFGVFSLTPLISRPEQVGTD